MVPLTAILILSLALTACGHFPHQDGMPARNETYSFSGPGSASVDRTRFTPVQFAEDSALLSPAELKSLAPVIAYLPAHPSARLLLVGHAQDPGTAEYNRVLGEQRALAVRTALLAAGVAEPQLQTLSLGAEPAGPTGAEGRRVEFGLIP